MTPSSCRDKLTELALSVLEKHGKLDKGPRSKAFGEFRDRLEVRGPPSDFMAAMNDMKYLSQWEVQLPFPAWES